MYRRVATVATIVGALAADVAADPDAPILLPGELPANPVATYVSVPSLTDTSSSQIAVAVNSPVGWLGGYSFGASLYSGFRAHHAIRANFARYDYSTPLVSQIGDLLLGGDGGDAKREGRFLDISAGYMYFPRKLWSGLFVEAALQLRDRETSEDDRGRHADVRTKTVAGRGLIGWSWLFYDHLFISVAIGASGGREIGTTWMRTLSPSGSMNDAHHISRWAASAEGFVRIGGAFKL